MAPLAEIEAYPRGFAHASRRAVAAGYDLVEIHGGQSGQLALEGHRVRRRERGEL